MTSEVFTLPKHSEKSWYKLDNAAKIYPAVQNAHWQNMYRISVVMRETVDSALLQQAVNDVLPRFPSMKIRMRRGFFWYFFEQNDAMFQVQEEQGYLMRYIKKKENNGYLFRVLYFDRRISIEAFHALTDGFGAFVFVKTMLAQYLRLKGVSVDCAADIKDINEAATAEELEDAYSKVPMSARRFSRKEPVAYQMRGLREIGNTFHMVSAQIKLSDIKREAAKHHVTLNVYLTAVMLYAVYCIQQEGRHEKRRHVRVSVPVNMRRLIPTESLRNFAFYVNVGIDPLLGEYTFEEIVSLTNHYLNYYMSPKFLYAGISANVAAERNLLVRMMPLFVKKLVLSGVFKMVGERVVSTTISNLGIISLPAAMQAHVEAFDVLMGRGLTAKSQCALITYGDDLRLTFTRNIRESKLERQVLTFLVKQGIGIKVSSNQE